MQTSLNVGPFKLMVMFKKKKERKEKDGISLPNNVPTVLVLGSPAILLDRTYTT